MFMKAGLELIDPINVLVFLSSYSSLVDLTMKNVCTVLGTYKTGCVIVKSKSLADILCPGLVGAIDPNIPHVHYHST